MPAGNPKELNHGVLEAMIALSFLEDVAGDEAKDYAAEVSLPGYAGKEGYQKETTDDCYPYGDGGRDGENHYLYFGPHYGECSAKSENGARSTHNHVKG